MFSWTSMHDKSLAPEGKNALVVQIFTPYAWMNGWETSSDDPLVRTGEYRKLKETVLDSIIEESEYIIPGLGGKVEFKELATPRSLSRFTLNPEGSTIGWTYDMYRSPLYGRFGRFSTPVKNLFNAGHYAVWPGGIVFSALAGKIAADGICDGFARALLW
jgi:phytoene dehydrogenase-like protein